MPPPKPISLAEFAHLWQGSRPPIPPRKLAVAFSGGADSLCLLYLMEKYLASTFGSSHKSLLSITVDHQLQPSSTDTANKCSLLSTLLGVPNAIAPIPWSRPPFPPRPTIGQAFEGVARKARYHLLLAESRRHRVDTVLMGHHADDQVETVLMRMMKAPSDEPSDKLKFGYAGARTCRPWGMGFGNEGDLGWAGLDGMRMSIARPLLSVGKDRIYATCEENGLEWIEDVTNFQPDITLRNAIRASLEGRDLSSDLDMATSQQLHASIERAQLAALQDPRNSGSASLRPLLRSWVTKNREYMDSLEVEANNFIRCNTFPSPPSTMLISTDRLSEEFLSPENSILRHEIILQILRTVSPFPWGSPRSQAGRQTSRLQTIAGYIFSKSYDPYSTPFTAGGDVIWVPALVDEDCGSFATINSGNCDDFSIERQGFRRGWIAARMLPRRYKPSTFTYVKSTPLELDLTPFLLPESYSSGSSDFSDTHSVLRDIEFLWDRRFAVRLQPQNLPNNIKARVNMLTGDSGFSRRESRILLIPHSRWVLPRLVLDTPNGREVLDEIGSRSGRSELDLEWINIQFARDPLRLSS